MTGTSALAILVILVAQPEPEPASAASTRGCEGYSFEISSESDVSLDLEYLSTRVYLLSAQVIETVEPGPMERPATLHFVIDLEDGAWQVILRGWDAERKFPVPRTSRGRMGNEDALAMHISGLLRDDCHALGPLRLQPSEAKGCFDVNESGNPKCEVEEDAPKINDTCSNPGDDSCATSPDPDSEPVKPPRQRTPLITAGAALTSLSALGILTLISGGVLIAQARSSVDTSTLPDRLDVIERGTTGNWLLATGTAATVALLVPGITLLAVGTSRRRKPQAAFAPMFLIDGAGLMVTVRAPAR